VGDYILLEDWGACVFPKDVEHWGFRIFTFRSTIVHNFLNMFCKYNCFIYLGFSFCTRKKYGF
jgi:hypothetical protein